MRLSVSIWRSPYERQEDYVETLTNISQLRFSTSAMGGFGDASFVIGVSGWDAVRYYRSFLGYHVVIFDDYGRRVYEGRIDTTEASPDGISVTCLGYYSLAGELVHGLIYPANETLTPTMLIKDTIDIAYNSSGLWRNDYSHIAEVNINIAPQDFSYDAKLTDAIEVATKYGDGGINPKPVYFAIWDYRTPYFYVEPDRLQANWFVFTCDFVEGNGLSLSRSRENIWNKIQVVYNHPLIGKTFTPWYEDKDSQRLFGLREGTISIGDSLPDIAELIAELAVKAYAYPDQSSTVGLSGLVMHSSGRIDFPYMVRAGCVIQVLDYDPSVAQLVTGRVGLDATTGFVMRTDYDADNNQLTLELGQKRYALDLLMAKLGYEGGSVR